MKHRIDIALTVYSRRVSGPINPRTLVFRCGLIVPAGSGFGPYRAGRRRRMRQLSGQFSVRYFYSFF
jgi:hypothetical protein